MNFSKRDDIAIILINQNVRNGGLYLVMDYVLLAGVPVGGKLSVCLIWNCMKFRIIILIIIIKRLGEILLSYMANTSHTHALTQCRCIFHHSTS